MLDDVRVQIDPNAVEINDCCKKELRNEISTIWGMDMLSVFTNKHRSISR